VLAGTGVGDFAATGIASSMRQLQHLDLRDCGLGDMVCLAAIVQLKQLTELRFEGNKPLGLQELMLLTGLSRLEQLGFVMAPDVTDDVVHRFWPAVQLC
jgi:hypothetical protein